MYLPTVTLNLETKTDEELMLLYQAGNESAFQVIYDRHFEKVYSFVLSRVRDREKGLDICQETFVRFHRHKDLYKGNLPLLPWLFTITKNTMLNKLEKWKRESTNLVFDEVAVSEASAQESEEKKDVTGLFEGLPTSQKDAIQLRYVDEKSFEEIAEILKTTPLNVRQMVSRGIKRIKALSGKGLKV